MIKRGILLYNHIQDDWQVWIGQQVYPIEQGLDFEIRIVNRYYQALLEKDFDWFISLASDTIFTLHRFEVYKIRIHMDQITSISAPF